MERFSKSQLDSDEFFAYIHKSHKPMVDIFSLTPNLGNLTGQRHSKTVADLTLRGLIMANSTSEQYLATVQVEAGRTSYELDVTSAVLRNGKDKTSFMLMCVDRTNSITIGEVKLTVRFPESSRVQSHIHRANVHSNGSNQSCQCVYTLENGSARLYTMFETAWGQNLPDQLLLQFTADGVGNIDLFLNVNSGWDDGLTWEKQNTYIITENGMLGGFDWRLPTGTYERFINMASRFGSFLHMLREFQLSGNMDYLYKVRDIMLNFVQKQPFPVYPASLFLGYRLYRMVIAYHYLIRERILTKQENVTLLQYFYDALQLLGEKEREQPPSFNGFDSEGKFTYHNISNWGVSETKGMFAVATYFREFDIAEARQKLAISRIEELFSRLFFPDGSYIEDSTNYSFGTLNEFLSIIQFGQLFGIIFPDKLMEKLEQAYISTVDMCTPDGFDTNYGDSTYVNRRQFFYEAYHIFHNDYFLFFASGTMEGKPPEETSRLYPDKGIFIMRNGFTEDSVYGMINTVNGIHGHHDVNALLVYGYGSPLLCDTGRFGYDMTHPVANWQLTETQSHNTVEINCLSQNRSSANCIDFCETTAKCDRYSGTTQTTPGYSFTRQIAFYKQQGFFYVKDTITPDRRGEHTFCAQNWHFMPNTVPVKHALLTAVATTKTDKANIAIIQLETCKTRLIKGYFSAELNDYNETQFVSFEAERTGIVCFRTLLIPLRPYEELDRVYRCTEGIHFIRECAFDLN